ncbi:DUF1800 domain-containing protein [Verrucomicrobium spinosum]|uniref:DUF1800 domain-containing protein n=2 Tax=Verrucomicrobium spinosum TaxID=2736 RepID=UPI0009D73C2F|nr:DUF1800 domain-containing protein [Verrucomicrobium spinosum]
MRMPALWVLVTWVAILPLPALHSQFTTLWSIGVENNDPQELGGETWPQNNLPGSATALDNDYYFAGTYGIGTVAATEAASQFERVLSTTNHTQRIHFNLNAGQATTTARIRFHFNQVWGGWWQATTNTQGPGYGNHSLEVRLNGALIGTKLFTTRGEMLVEANAGTFTLATGENVLEITRVTTSPSSPDGALQFDYLQLDLHPTALQDADGDGLPRWWEEDHGFDDQNAADAAFDPDQDGLTNLQEFTRTTLPRNPDTDGDGLKDGYETHTGTYVDATHTGTDPNNPDTDGDSLQDGEEVFLNPRPNPLLADTDNDGAPDAWEVRTGFDPTSSSSKPPAFPGAIGIKFVSDLTPEHGLLPKEVTGITPQMNWNSAMPLSTWNDPTGSEVDIVTPIAGKVVDATGVDSGVKFSWTNPGHTWGTGNGGGPTQKLFDGMLSVASDNAASVTVTQVPYATYDVIAYVGSQSEASVGYVRLNNNSATDLRFSSASSRPEKTFIEQGIYNATYPRRGNTVRFRNVTGSTFNLQLYRTSYYNVGLHGIQIVNATADTDSDGMPDHWEYRYGFNPGSNTDATQDPDSDGLNNVGEKNRGTDPRVADTDGDGLLDLVETGTGIWASATDTGSNPLLQDTDGDGLTDGAEVATLPLPTDPNNADTDGDGRSDLLESTERTNPLAAEATTFSMPVVTTSPSRTFDWTVENAQLVWDHSRNHSGFNDDLFALSITNAVRPREAALYFALPIRNGNVTYYFHTNYWGAFSNPDSDTQHVWDSDWSSPPADLKTAMGFSGRGRVDISDRLRFRVSATSTGAQTSWNVTFAIINQRTGSTVVSRTYNGCALATSAHNNTATWQTNDDPAVVNRFNFRVPDAVTVYFQATPLENTTAFSAHKDTDNDGMPDVWETQYGLNINSAADAPLDPDSDGLKNVDEYTAGTSPLQRDTDGDGAQDGVEVSTRSNPLLASSLPPLYRGTGSSGEDLNGNGLADAWELWAGSFNLMANVDTDGDGMSNAAEAAAGTDPFDPAGRLWSAIAAQGNNILVRWPALVQKQQTVWQSGNLTDWSPATGTPVTLDGVNQQTFTDVLNGPSRIFYKVRVNDLDRDGDGVSDWTEQHVLGSDPLAANSSRSATGVDANQDGVVDTTYSGDYVTLVERLQGTAAAGGFPGSGSGGGGGTGIASGSTAISRTQAARFLTQSTFGPTVEDIQAVQEQGYASWITQQAALPATLHSPYILGIYNDIRGQRTGRGYSYGGSDNEYFLFGNNMMTAFARGAVNGQDQLRQRMAFALSQILVASRRDSALENKAIGMASFYDIFVRNGLGNYLDVLREVTFHPIMGRYLSHVGNQKAHPEINQYPDENYAREVMQLFTIGLWELNPDGTRMLDSGGHPIPTYTNTEITQVARVLTGLWYGGQEWGNGGWDDAAFATPMTMHSDRHDFGKKTLLRGFVVPSRSPSAENALRDIDDLIRMLFEHPNTGVFVGRQLIQFFVTDNPSPAYVQRVSAVFANNGQGVRGDLLAVIKAILLDEEARDARYSSGTSFGRLKEPVIRAMSIARAFGLKGETSLLWWDWNDFFNVSRQEPTFSPSVFNFYRPDYKAPGVLTQNSLSSPVFQITDSFSSISFPNRLWDLVQYGFRLWNVYQFPLDMEREKALAATPELLVDHLNTILCAGNMEVGTRTHILSAINQLPANELAIRAQVAAYLAIVSPEGAVIR